MRPETRLHLSCTTERSENPFAARVHSILRCHLRFDTQITGFGLSLRHQQQPGCQPAQGFYAESILHRGFAGRYGSASCLRQLRAVCLGSTCTQI